MDHFIKILVLTFIYGCTNSQSANNVKQKEDGWEKEVSVATKDVFQSDSSNVELWCSSKILGQTAESIEKLRPIHVADFLATFHKNCKNNVEYSQYSNELLFEIANRNPNMLLEVLTKNSSLDKELIVNEFKSPTHDGINLEETINRINQSTFKSDVQTEIIAALKIAKSKY